MPGKYAQCFGVVYVIFSSILLLDGQRGVEQADGGRIVPHLLAEQGQVAKPCGETGMRLTQYFFLYIQGTVVTVYCSLVVPLRLVVKAEVVQCRGIVRMPLA